MSIKKGVRIENEYPWHSERQYPPFYSEGIDHIKRMYKGICGIDSSGKNGGFGDDYARNFLSTAHRIPLEIIHDILVCIDCLDDHCDKALYSAKFSRKEYNDVMKVVQRVALRIRQDGLTDRKIKPWVTELVKGMLGERERCGKINIKDWNLEWDSRIGYGKKMPKISAKPSNVPKKKNFSYSPGVTKAVYAPKTVEEIQKKFCQISRNLTNLPAIDPYSVEPFKKVLVQAVCDLAKIGVSLKDLEKNQSGGDGWGF